MAGGRADRHDLHDGRIDPARHRAFVFPGHDEYWSQAARDTASKAVAHGTHLAFLAANNVYFRIRLEDSAAGRAHRDIACYQQDSVFVAGTFQWPLALHVEGKVDKRIRTATKNLLDRMVR